MSMIIFVVKYDVLVFVPLHVFVMCRNILRLADTDSKLFKSIQSPPIPLLVSHTSTCEEPQWFAF